MLGLKLFFIAGPLRTGSSLLSRCLDDHPEVLCFCESEANRTLMRPYLVVLHFLRMQHHGFSHSETAQLLNRKSQNCVATLMNWYAEAAKLAKEKWRRPDAHVVGDKSPDCFLIPELVASLAQDHRILYSIRDPGAIFRSIVRSPDSTTQEMHQRWADFRKNYEVWEPYLERENVSVVKYEDLVFAPEITMQRVYSHVGVPYSSRFLEPFSRVHPSRFLWKTAINWETGIRNDFDVSKIDFWRNDLTPDELDFVRKDSVATRFRERFEYELS